MSIVAMGAVFFAGGVIGLICGYCLCKNKSQTAEEAYDVLKAAQEAADQEETLAAKVKAAVEAAEKVASSDSTTTAS